MCVCVRTVCVCVCTGVFRSFVRKEISSLVCITSSIVHMSPCELATGMHFTASVCVCVSVHVFVTSHVPVAIAGSCATYSVATDGRLT